ncbi:MAG: hypothetical protein ACYDCQ_16655 [Dehalococcoidia bacterium]
MRVHNLGRGILGVLSGLLLAGGGLVHSSRASADFEWCWDDPVVVINGQLLQTLIGAQGSVRAIQQGGFQATVVYTVPAGVSTQVLAVTNPFFRETVIFQLSNALWTPGTPVPVTVSVAFNGVGVFNTDMRNREPGAPLSDVTGTTVTGLATSFSLQ